MHVRVLFTIDIKHLLNLVKSRNNKIELATYKSFDLVNYMFFIEIVVAWGWFIFSF